MASETEIRMQPGTLSAYRDFTLNARRLLEADIKATEEQAEAQRAAKLEVLEQR